MFANAYVQLIKREYIEPKTISFIDDIVIYTDKRTVYKIVVRYCENVFKKVSKIFRKNNKTITSHFVFLNDFPKITILDDLVKNAKYDRLIMVYNNHTGLITVHEGETH